MENSLIYEPPTLSARSQFWDYLDVVGSTFSGLWLLAGDFSNILNSSENKGSRPYSSSNKGGFRQFIEDSPFMDLGRQQVHMEQHETWQCQHTREVG